LSAGSREGLRFWLLRVILAPGEGEADLCKCTSFFEDNPASNAASRYFFAETTLVGRTSLGYIFNIATFFWSYHQVFNNVFFDPFGYGFSLTPLQDQRRDILNSNNPSN
jgi:hypothetical protein